MDKKSGAFLNAVRFAIVVLLFVEVVAAVEGWLLAITGDSRVMFVEEAVAAALQFVVVIIVVAFGVSSFPLQRLLVNFEQVR